MTFEELMKDPDFLGLPDGEKHKVLARTDADYSALPLVEQRRVLSSIAGRAPATTQTAYDPVTNVTPQKGYAGALLGEAPAFIGSMIGGTAKTALRRIPYAGLAAAGGEGYHQAYQAITGDPDAPVSLSDSAQRMAEAATLYSAGQAVGEPLGLLGRAIFNKMFKVRPEYVMNDTQAAEQALSPYVESHLRKGPVEKAKLAINQYLPEGAQLNTKQYPGFTLGQQTEDISGAARIENIVESSWFGRDPIKSYKLAQQKGARDLADAKIEELWGAAERLPASRRGEVFVSAFDEAEDTFKTAARQKYAAVDELLSTRNTASTTRQFPLSPMETNNIVDIRAIKQWAAGEAKRASGNKGIGASERGDAFIKKVAALDDYVSFSKAQDIRSGMIAEIRMAEGKDVAKGLAKQATGMFDGAMERAAKTAGNDVYDAWRNANTFYREGKETFNNDFVRKLIDKGRDYPEEIGKAIFKSGDVSKIKMAKSVLRDSPETWRAMQVGHLEDVIARARNRASDVSAKTIFNELKSMGREAYEEGFTAQQRQIIDVLEKAMHYTQKKPQGSGGSMLVQLLQANAIPAVGGALVGYGTLYGEDAQWDKIVPGAALLATPRIAANMMLNPKYHALFLKGMSSEKARAMPALMKLGAAAIEVDNEMKGHRTLIDTIADQAQYR